MSSSGASGVVRLRVICGPTGAGKSAIALRLAEARQAAIVSADSRQIYRGFDVGTAKPSTAEQHAVPHFGVDVVEPTARFSAAAWASAVPEWIGAAAASGRSPLIVGGTGFYLRALFTPLFESPPMFEDRRASMAAHLQSLPTAELRRWCRELDPRRADLGRTQLVRAIETALLTGARISALHESHARAPSHAPRYLVIDPGRALDAAIAARVDRMLATGWLDEVRSLIRLVPAGAPAWTATGYDLLRQVVLGERGLDDVRDSIVMRTRQYAKRQRTWFRHQLPANSTRTLDPGDDLAFERALAWWGEGE